MKEHRDGIPKKQPNDTAIRLQTAIAISFAIRSLSYLLYVWDGRMLDYYVIWHFIKST